MPGGPAPGSVAPGGPPAGGDDRANLFDYSRVAGGAAASGVVAADADDDDPFASLDAGGADPMADGGPAAAPSAAPAPGDLAPPGPPAPHEPEYRVKKPDGRIFGPVPLDELKAMAESGEIAPGDQVARDNDEFRLISQYEECAHLLERAAAHYRVRSASIAYQGGPRKKWPWLVGGLVVVLLAFAGVGRYAPKVIPRALRKPLAPVLAALAPAKPPLPKNPVLAALPGFRLQVVDAKGKAADHVAKARALMAKDTAEGDRQAELELKRALILSPGDTDAIGYYILATAYLDDWHAGPKVLQQVLSFGDYVTKVAPDRPASSMGQAAALLMLGAAQSATARGFAQKAVAGEKNDVDAGLVLARATNHIDHMAALKMLHALEKAHPEAPRVLMETADVCRDAGDFACAEKALRARLKATPGHEQASADLAQLYVLLGKYDAARAVYRDILKLDSERVDAELEIAVLDYEIGHDLKRAARRLAHMRKSRMDLADEVTAARILAHSAAVARLQGHLDVAEGFVKKVLAKRPLDGPAAYQGALLAILQKQPDGGLSATVTATLGKGETLSMLRALVADAKGDDATAEQQAQAAADAAPGRLEPILLAASLEGRLGHPQQAYLLMRKAITIDPAEARRSRRITDYYDGQVLYQTMQAGFSDLVQRDPQQGLAYAGLGMAKYLAGDDKAAKAAFDKATDLDAQNVPAFVYLGQLARDRHDLPGAERQLRQAVDADHLAPLPQYLLGRVLEAEKHDRQAQKAYRAALRLDPGFHYAQVRLALMQAHRGHKDQAVATLRQVLSSHPDSTAARLALYQIE